MSSNKNYQKKRDVVKNLKRQLQYLVTLEKEYKKSTQDKISTIQYTVNEGDMESVKTVDITPISLQNSPSLV